jgi:ABC-type iron transport system FetAB ATPase subunit
MSSPLIRAEDLVLAGFPGAAPMRFSLSQGECWLISGPPGGGKSTLARTVLGLVPPLAGRIELFGQDIEKISEKNLRQVRLKFALLQSVDRDGLLPAWSVFDNLALAMRQQEPERFADAAVLSEALLSEARRYGIPESWLEDPVALRKRQQRTALSLWRALRFQPELVIVDGLLLDQNLVGDAIDVDRLLTDALVGEPAIIVLTVEHAHLLPERLRPERFRRASLHDGSLKWAATDFPRTTSDV